MHNLRFQLNMHNLGFILNLTCNRRRCFDYFPRCFLQAVSTTPSGYIVRVIGHGQPTTTCVIRWTRPIFRIKTETNAFADNLSRVMHTGQASKISPPPSPPPPTPQKMRHGTQMAVTSASVTATPPPPPIKEYTYEPPKQERVEDDDDEDDYNEDDNFVEDEARVYGTENVGPVASPYLMPYV